MLSSEAQTWTALPRLHDILQDGCSPEKQFLGNMQYAGELQLCHIPSGALTGEGGACMLRGDRSHQAAPDTAPQLCWVVTKPRSFSGRLCGDEPDCSECYRNNPFRGTDAPRASRTEDTLFVRQSATLTLRGVLCGAQAVSQPRLPC